MLSSSEIRQQFIDFFCKKHGHTNIPSSPVVPHDDPTLLFANAGMNQFKPYFLGTEKPPHVRVANTQKCIRAGGKHNDLDDVGKDTYHHTFFEMLGNWSFGDYFKKDAIAFAWELLTEVWKLDKTRLHVTVFEGDPANGIPKDEEAAGFWKAVGVTDSHIHLGNKKDNFWEMGNTGPCGPCTEVHIDRTPDKSGGPLVNGGTDRVIEIWNLVFIQFNRNEDQSLTPLPAQHVDTGMGFERICSVIQGKNSNYDTDVFMPIVDALGKITGKKYGGRLDDAVDTGFRVIADHLRMATFAITDGARPGNKKRDAVLRSVIRRAVRYGYMYFDRREPFLFSLVPVLVEQMGGAFPELRVKAQDVVETLRTEEKDFLRTIARGIEFFEATVRNSELAATCDPVTEEMLASPPSALTKFMHPREVAIYQRAGKGTLPGDMVFKLYATHGFPPDMTRQMALDRGYAVEEQRFHELMDEHERLSRGKELTGQVAISGELPQTDDTKKYTPDTIDAKILGWVKDNAVVQGGLLTVGESVALLVDQTNFYAEQGGQIGDKGVIFRRFSGSRFEVTDTKRLGNAVLHFGTLVEGALSVGDGVELTVDGRRIDIMRNHTATHLLNLALREVLGSHVEQKGSLVDEQKTRFDFSHDKPVTAEELREIERRVNRQIITDQPVAAVVVSLPKAKELPGVRAVFGEKYPDPVRVVMIGAETPDKLNQDNSVEFCGGTHMPRTGLIGYFKILSQEGVAKGIRRITAVTGKPAYDDVQNRSAVVDDLAAKFQCRPDELPIRVDALQEQLKALQSQLKKAVGAALTGVVDELIASAPEVGGAKIVVAKLPDGASNDTVRTQIDRVKQKCGSAFVVFGWSEGEGNASIIAAVTPDLVKRGLKAGDVVKQVAPVIGGGGGGKPDMAQAGGKDPAKLPEALQKAERLGRELLK